MKRLGGLLPGIPLVAAMALAGAMVLSLAGSAPAGTSGLGSRATLPAGLVAAGSSAVGYVPPSLKISRSFPIESRTIPDFTFLGGSTALITPRTDKGVRATLAYVLTSLALVRCWDAHAWNPSSDHPLGRACDFTQDYRTSDGVARGWRQANWYVANQAALGVNYVIWQNSIWTAGSPRAWVPYQSSVYGCPNPANITGCHMDHIHVSFY